jgi:EAL domain-containing protein (putative c-di-GMP-specific phosphodiesterase class I)
MGVQIHVDDFGMGYSNLNYLSRFPLSALKIDRSFISSLQDDVNSQKIVQAIVNMTHLLEMKAIAEGVETPVQLKHLEKMGCDYVQGYLLGKPVSTQQMSELLQRAFK